MKKKSWALLWIGFVIIGIAYLFIYSGLVGVILGFGVRAFQAIKYHLDKNTALVIFVVLKDIAIIWWVRSRRWSK